MGFFSALIPSSQNRAEEIWTVDEDKILEEYAIKLSNLSQVHIVSSLIRLRFCGFSVTHEVKIRITKIERFGDYVTQGCSI